LIKFGSTNRQAALSAIEELKRQAYGISYLDQMFFQCGKDALDKEALNVFFMRFLGIKKLLLNHFFHYVTLKKNNGDIFPTFIGVILFGQKNLPELREFDYSGNPRPEFEEKGQYFCVTLRAKHQMISHLEEIYRTLRSKGPLSSSEISKAVDIHQNTAIKRLKELIDSGSVEKTGSGKNTKYTVKE